MRFYLRYLIARTAAAANYDATTAVAAPFCSEQREEGTDEEEGDAGDYIGDRLAHARLEATGQLYREVRRVETGLAAACSQSAPPEGNRFRV